MVRRQKEYDGDLRQLASMRAFLSDACHERWQAKPAEEDRLHRLALALTEAASNIILHSHRGQPHRSITLTVEVDDDEVCVTLLHAGEPFDPRSEVAPVFDGSRENGFGLYLIRKCVDEVRYGKDEQGRSVIHLVQRRIPPHEGEDHATHG
jgi:serine/threonine-protein kinase RsbW